ncbi:MAG: MFS transporter [Faecousia sp.]
MKEKSKLTALERSWVLYDIGNSAFILLVTTLVPIYFNSLATAGGLDESKYLAYWGYAGSVSTLLVAIIAPICGTLADHKGFKKTFFLACMLLGAFGCAALGGVGSWLAFLVVFVIAKVGYSSSLVFYDAMLPEVTTEARMDKVSSMGYAYGYIGSVIPFVICLLLVLFGGSFGIGAGTAMVISFLITAVWWLVCTQPLLKRYRQTAFVERQGHPVADTFRQLGRTFREVKQQKHIFLYLLAFFFFIDGVYTIIEMATAYGTALGLDTTGLLLALLLTQIVAFPCSILFGRLSEKYDTGLLIKVCILAYTCITLFAVFLVAQWQFWVLAALVGMFQGGIQALSRSYLGKIIPAERSGEYFGLMDICGKGASFLGTTLIAVVSQLTAGWTIHVFGLELQNESIAVGTLVVIFVIGFVLFCKADKMNKQQIHR